MIILFWNSGIIALYVYSIISLSYCSIIVQYATILIEAISSYDVGELIVASHW